MSFGVCACLFLSVSRVLQTYLRCHKSLIWPCPFCPCFRVCLHCFSHTHETLKSINLPIFISLCFVWVYLSMLSFFTTLFPGYITGTCILPTPYPPLSPWPLRLFVGSLTRHTIQALPPSPSSAVLAHTSSNQSAFKKTFKRAAHLVPFLPLSPLRLPTHPHRYAQGRWSERWGMIYFTSVSSPRSDLE